MRKLTQFKNAIGILAAACGSALLAYYGFVRLQSCREAYLSRRLYFRWDKIVYYSPLI